ncbi:FecR domain-containing protein [bacterium]|nr:FecR domain-containing protein [bacterium]
MLFSKTKWLLLLSCIATSSTNAAENIGGIFEQSGSVGKISRTTGETLQAELKTNIVSMDEVETANGRLKIKFVDDTQVSLTENTYMEINEYVFDPDPNKSKMALNFVSGTARFATGGLGLVARENITTHQLTML